MTVYLTPVTSSPRLRLPPTFRHWQQRVNDRGSLPVIAIAGSRGKSSLIRLLEAIFNVANLRVATWTNGGVEVRGRHQTGELVPWGRALQRLAEGSLDVAIQELHWPMVNAVGLPAGTYPLVAVTNICVNSDLCLAHNDTRQALQAYPRIARAARADGVLVLNGEDFAVAGTDAPISAPTVLVAHSKETPLLRNHLATEGSAAWVDGGRLWFGHPEATVPLAAIEHLGFAGNGAAGFQVLNAMAAASIALACGMDVHTVSRGLTGYVPSMTALPGSFNLLRLQGATAVVDRLAPSWFLRPVLRAANPGAKRRQITILGKFDGMADHDLQETGRLLGRARGAILVHSQADHPERLAYLKRGIAMNDYPPVLIHVPTERRAINRALKLLRPRDVLLVLADDAPAVLRALQRAGGESWVHEPSAAQR